MDGSSCSMSPEVVRRVWRNSDCAARTHRIAAQRRPQSPTYFSQYAGSLRPCCATPGAPWRRAPFRQTLLGVGALGTRGVVRRRHLPARRLLLLGKTVEAADDRPDALPAVGAVGSGRRVAEHLRSPGPRVVVRDVAGGAVDALARHGCGRPASGEDVVRSVARLPGDLASHRLEADLDVAVLRLAARRRDLCPVEPDRRADVRELDEVALVLVLSGHPVARVEEVVVLQPA